MSALKHPIRAGLQPPSTDDIRIATESSRRLGAIVGEVGQPEAGQASVAAKVVVEVRGRPMPETLEIPLAALTLLRMILSEMAKGNAVTLTPVHAELTTHQAADVLNVSRPYLIKQLEAGKLKYRMVGTHRRIALGDLLEYKERSDAKRDSALEELARMTQELNEDD